MINDLENSCPQLGEAYYYAYKQDAKQQALAQSARAMTGADVVDFQGAYSAHPFTAR